MRRSGWWINFRNIQSSGAATEQILRSVADRGVGFTRKPGEDIVIHPGSGSVAKCWPLENFLELAGKLKQSGKRIRFLTGEVGARSDGQRTILTG